MKALDEYFLMVVFPLLLNKVQSFVHVFAHSLIWTEKHGIERFEDRYQLSRVLFLDSDSIKRQKRIP